MNKVRKTFQIAVVKFVTLEGEIEEKFFSTTERKIKSYAKKHNYLVKEIVWGNENRVMDVEALINHAEIESEEN